MATPRPDIRIGISGWRYAPWRGVFYPPGLPQRRELNFASRMLNTIEINGSFYSLQSPSLYAQWRDSTPDDFVFSVKGPKYLTHMRRLKDVEIPLANFFANGILQLRHKLGPILWQFPPMMPFDHERFDAFFSMLPHDTEQAVAVAAAHDDKVNGRVSLDIDRCRPIRHAVEIRHDSFRDPPFIALLRKHRVALVVADTAGKWPLMEDVTSDFVYVRLHGDKELYASGYSRRALDDWARRMTAWRAGREVSDARKVSNTQPPKRASRDVYCYFDNDVKVHAPYDAASLARRLGVDTPLGEQGQPVWPPGWTAPEIRRTHPAFKQKDAAVVH